MPSDQEKLQRLQSKREKQADKVLDLKEPCYDLETAANKLHISIAQLYRYLGDPELQIEKLWQGKKRLVWASDIKHIWMIRNGIYSQQPRITRRREAAKLRKEIDSQKKSDPLKALA